MKIIKEISKYIVGGLFIFSGLIKLNDPVGTSIKMHEYFEVFADDIAGFFQIFVPYALPIAVFLVVLEVILGIAVLFNYKMKLTSTVLFVLIVFFTFLTFYSANYNKVTDCGCFGDAIKLTPWESFTKDIILLFFIGIVTVFSFLGKYKNVLPHRIGNITIGSITIICTYIAIHAINHLPFIDFRTYKIGNHIPTLMQPSAPLEFEYVMEKDGEQIAFDNYIDDPAYKFIETREKNPEAKPKITDYSLSSDEGEFTEESFVGNKLFVIVYDAQKANKDIDAIKSLVNNLSNYDVESVILTSSIYDQIEAYRHETQLAIPFYYADATVLKTMVRANPGIFLMQNGTIKGKWHFNDTPEAKDVLQLLR